jgi:hypothetical protein
MFKRETEVLLDLRSMEGAVPVMPLSRNSCALYMHAE